jgi:hypothetical protein
MSLLYADRVFFSVNGVELLDVKSAMLRQSDGTKAVATMTRNRRNKGFVKGNREISLDVSIATQNKLGSPKLEDVDFDNNDVAATFEVGGDRYTVVGLNFADVDQGSQGVGSEAPKNFKLLGLDVIDQVGNSALFDISF